MSRKWKNSDDNTYFSDKSLESRLEKLRCDLINGYSRKKYQKKNNSTPVKKHNYNKNK